MVLRQICFASGQTRFYVSGLWGQGVLLLKFIRNNQRMHHGVHGIKADMQRAHANSRRPPHQGAVLCVCSFEEFVYGD